LKIGQTIAFFQLRGISPQSIDSLKSLDNGIAIPGATDFKNPAGKPSGVLEYLEGRRFRAHITLS
jgi:hypothetical protein